MTFMDAPGPSVGLRCTLTGNCDYDHTDSKPHDYLI